MNVHSPVPCVSAVPVPAADLLLCEEGCVGLRTPGLAGGERQVTLPPHSLLPPHTLGLLLPGAPPVKPTVKMESSVIRTLFAWSVLLDVISLSWEETVLHRKDFSPGVYILPHRIHLFIFSRRF